MRGIECDTARLDHRDADQDHEGSHDIGRDLGQRHPAAGSTDTVQEVGKREGWQREERHAGRLAIGGGQERRHPGKDDEAKAADRRPRQERDEHAGAMEAAGKRQRVLSDIMRQKPEHAGGEAEGGHRAEHIDPHQQGGEHAETAGPEPSRKQDLAQKANDGRDDPDRKCHGGT